MNPTALPELWATTELGSLADLFGGGTPSRKVLAYFKGDTPWLTGYDLPEDRVQSVYEGRECITTDAIRSSATSVVPVGTVLLTTRVRVGKVAVAEVPLCFSQDVTGIDIRERDALDPYFLAYYLFSQRSRIERYNRGSTISGVTRTDVANTPVPLPPLSEQRRIADVLRQVIELRRLRQTANERAARLLPALFEDRFGDSKKRTRGWPTAKLSSMGDLDRGRSRHRPRDAPHLYGGVYPFIQTGDVANSNGWITSYSQTYSEAGLAQSRLWPAGTLCITIAANIAQTGILTFSACFPDSVVGFVPGPEATAEYVQYWLKSIQQQIEARAPKLAQRNINLDILRNLDIPKAPIELQREFARVAEHVRTSRALLAQSQERIDDLGLSLLSHAFSGELTAGWRAANEELLAHEAAERDRLLGLTRPTTPTISLEQERVPAPTRRAALTSTLGQNQRKVLDAVDVQQGYFTAERLADDSDLELTAVQRALELLVRTGLVQLVSAPTRPAAGIVYAKAYRRLQPGEDDRPDIPAQPNEMENAA